VSEADDTGGQQPIAYTQLIGNNSVNANDLTMISVPIPRGTAFVTLNGTMGPDYWYNGVTWDPVPTLGKNPTTINCYTGWDVPNTLLMFQPLDPTVEYLMTVGVPYNPTKMGLGLTSVTFYAGSL
jgi:hypothetical protein